MHRPVTCMHQPVMWMHRPVTSKADACTYCMGSKVSNLSWIYLHSSYFEPCRQKCHDRCNNWIYGYSSLFLGYLRQNDTNRNDLINVTPPKEVKASWCCDIDDILAKKVCQWKYSLSNTPRVGVIIFWVTLPKEWCHDIANVFVTKLWEGKGAL